MSEKPERRSRSHSLRAFGEVTPHPARSSAMSSPPSPSRGEGCTEPAATPTTGRSGRPPSRLRWSSTLSYPGSHPAARTGRPEIAPQGLQACPSRSSPCPFPPHDSGIVDRVELGSASRRRDRLLGAELIAVERAARRHPPHGREFDVRERPGHPFRHRPADLRQASNGWEWRRRRACRPTSAADCGPAERHDPAPSPLCRAGSCSFGALLSREEQVHDGPAQIPLIGVSASIRS